MSRALRHRGIASCYGALMRAQELRTCGKCGHSWKVWRYDTKHHYVEPLDDLPIGLGQAEAITSKVVYLQRENGAVSSATRIKTGSKAGPCLVGASKCGSKRFSEQRGGESKPD